VAVCYNPPWIFAMFWKAISPFIDPSTYRKIRFVNPKKAKETERMSKMFDMSVIDSDLGGEKAGLSDVARYVTQRILNPRLLSRMASYDVTREIWQALGEGPHVRRRRIRVGNDGGGCAPGQSHRGVPLMRCSPWLFI
jgi:hypothetical protein